jgi:hypothetical protein
MRLRGCTASQRGVFFGLYCLMHQWDGRLETSLDDAASLLGLPRGEVAEGVLALTKAGIFSIDGTMLGCPELARQLALSETRARAGRSGGNASLGHPTRNFAQAKNASKCRGSGSGSRSDSESLSGSQIQKKKRDSVDWRSILAEPEFERLAGDGDLLAFWPEWEGYRRERKRPLGARSIREQLRMALHVGSAAWIEAARRSIANGWQGVFVNGSEHRAPAMTKRDAALADTLANMYALRDARRPLEL